MGVVVPPTEQDSANKKPSRDRWRGLASDVDELTCRVARGLLHNQFVEIRRRANGQGATWDERSETRPSRTMQRKGEGLACFEISESSQCPNLSRA